MHLIDFSMLAMLLHGVLARHLPGQSFCRLPEHMVRPALASMLFLIGVRLVF
jgi:hypothetical protein